MNSGRLHSGKPGKFGDGGVFLWSTGMSKKPSKKYGYLFFNLLAIDIEKEIMKIGQGKTG